MAATAGIWIRDVRTEAADAGVAQARLERERLSAVRVVANTNLHGDTYLQPLPLPDGLLDRKHERSGVLVGEERRLPRAVTDGRLDGNGPESGSLADQLVDVVGNVGGKGHEVPTGVARIQPELARELEHRVIQRPAPHLSATITAAPESTSSNRGGDGRS
jgi:hypothetical protein